MLWAVTHKREAVRRNMWLRVPLPLAASERLCVCNMGSARKGIWGSISSHLRNSPDSNSCSHPPLAIARISLAPSSSFSRGARTPDLVKDDLLVCPIRHGLYVVEPEVIDRVVDGRPRTVLWWRSDRVSIVFLILVECDRARGWNGRDMIDGYFDRWWWKGKAPPGLKQRLERSPSRCR